MSVTAGYEVATWNQIFDMLLNQARKIRGNGFKPDVIVGICRGGLVPARILQDLLEIPKLSTIQIEFYTAIAKTLCHPNLIQPLNTQAANKKILLVDDVSDSGKTLQLAITYLKHQGSIEIKTATLYTKPKTTTPPDYTEKQTSRWIVFPWDAKETVRKIFKAQENKRKRDVEIAELIRAGLPQKLAEKFQTEIEQED